MKQKTGHPPCVDVAILLRTAQGPEQKTFVPVGQVEAEAEAVRQEPVQVQLLVVVPQLPVCSPVAQARKHRLVC